MGEVSRIGLSLEQQARLEERLRGRQPLGPATARPRLPRAPLSFEQLGIWLDGQLRPDPSFYNRPCIFRLQGPLDVHSLRSALQRIVERHDVLRMRLAGAQRSVQAEVPLQEVSADAGVNLREMDCRAAAEMPGEVDTAIRRFVDEPFDLQQGPLFRMMLVRLNENEHRLVFCFHHLVFDAASEQILLEELASIYDACVSQRTPDVAALPKQYLDYAQQQQQTDPERWSRSIEYWRNEVAAAVPVLLPFDSRPAADEADRVGRVAATLPNMLVTQLNALAAAQQTTLFSILLSAFQVLLARCCGQAEITVACPLNRRTHSDWEPLIGVFVDAKPFRCRIDADRPYSECLALVRHTLLDALEHNDVSMQKVLERSSPASASSRDISTAWFNFENFDRRPRWAGELQIEAEDWVQNQPLGHLSLEITCNNETYGTVFVFDGRRFRHAAIERLNLQYVCLLEGIVGNPHAAVGDLPLIPESERQQLLGAWSGSESSFCDDTYVHELFEAQVDRAPDAVALVFEDRSLTYRELNARANQMAHALRGRGVSPGALVGVCLERSPEMVIGMLGILKAGAAYLPLAPSYPRERLEFMLRDADVKLVVTRNDLADTLMGMGCVAFCLDAEQTLLADQPADNPPLSRRSGSLAYVIFTSGSTGKPKGVQVEHRGILRLLTGTDYARFGTDRVFLLLSPASFDVSTFELWGALLHGARLVLAPDGIPDFGDLERLLQRHGVTTLWLTASLFNAIVEERPTMLAGAEQVLIGGEALSVRHIRLAQTRLPAAVELINGYGPTECTTFACCYCIPRDLDNHLSSIPIGRPIANTRVYIFDARRRLVPAGIPGELYIGGAGLARGYLNRPELTAERFVHNPFEPGKRLYRTGDLCRFLPDGNIEYLGRLDQQVKIRGFRIELGEIEAALARHPDVRQCVVEARDEVPGNKRLVAYLVAANPAAPPRARDLRGFLQPTLPEYMLPAAFVLLDSLPLTPHGKVDRKGLPAPDAAPAFLEGQPEYVSPRDATEELLANIWAEVLKIPSPGIHDGFFALGGHSLLAMQVVWRIRRVLNVEVPLRHIFEHPTIAELAQQLQAAQIGNAAPSPPLVRVPRDGALPLSFAQQRLWFLDQFEVERAVYNIPFAVRLQGPLDAACLSQSLSILIQRHEVLRTTFPMRDGEPVQVIAPALEIEVSQVDLSAVPEEEGQQQACALAAEEFRRPFDLSCGPLLRARLLRLAPEEHVLLLTLHHIICDGWSRNVLLRELTDIYEALREGRPVSVPPLPVQYGDFAIWQRAQLKGEMLAGQMAWWEARLAGATPLLELPTDRVRPVVQSHAGARESLTLPRELSAALHDLSRREEVTLFMTLLAGFKILLQRYGGQSDVVVGTAIAGRTDRDLEGLIGCFVNSLVLRTDLSGEPTVRELLGRVRETTLGAYAHQDVPFEHLVQRLRPPRNLGASPLFQVLFVLQNTPRTAMHIPRLEASVLEAHNGLAKFDLTLSMTETPDGLHAALEYRTDLFDPATMQQMLHDLRVVWEGMTLNPLQQIGHLSLNARGSVDQRWLSASRVLRAVSLPAAVARPLATKRPAYLAPGNPTEALLVQIWEELLEARRIGILDDFFDRGGHSLLAVRMLSRIEQVFGRKVRLSTLFQEATILALARALVEPATRGAETPWAEVQAGGGGPPFFFLHGDYFGDGLYCRQLARHLGADQCFYAIHPFGLAGQPPPDSIESMAAAHLACIRAVQPHGPYLLGGYCNGAVDVFEMAQQLAACGQQVDALVLIGPPPRNLAALRIDAGHMLPRPALLGSDVDEHARRAALLKLCFRAMARYVPRPYAGRVTLLQPGEEIRQVPDPARGWKGVAAHVDVHVVPGDHTTALTRWMPALAERLRRCLEQCR